MNQTVFVNRILNLKKIKYIGVDMDHTLIRYHTDRFEALVFQLVIQQLIQCKNYPKEIESFTFSMEEAIRGLVVDSENGNILKLNRYGAIRRSDHGTKIIKFNDQQAFYRSTYADLSNPNYMAIDTAFSIAFCVLYRQLVDLKDKNPMGLPSYQIIAQDVLSIVDKVHADGSLKGIIRDNLESYVIKDKALIDGIQKFIRYGKKLFIITNSEFNYTKTLLDYAINPFLPPENTWQDLFEYVVCFSNKPRFFYDNLRFLKIDTETGTMVNQHGPLQPGVYQGGNAVTFTQALNVKDDEILYVGDHIYGDIVRLKKHCNWRTALVVEELGQEIQAQIKAHPIEQQIVETMKIKANLEETYIQTVSEQLENNLNASAKISLLQTQLNAIDERLSGLLHQQDTFYNPTWGRVFRVGAEESFFAYQVDRYACIYMEKLSDLFQCSPLTYFRAHRRTLAHDEVDV